MAKLIVDDASLSIPQVCEKLGIDPTAVPMNKARIFEINPNRLLGQDGQPRKDSHGNVKLPRRIGMTSKFNVYVKSKGKSFLVRYGEGKPDAKIMGKTNYLPSQVFLEGGVDEIKGDLEFFFMYIHPECFNSPFRETNGKWRYQYRDNEAKAKQELIDEDWYIKAMSIVMGDHALDEPQLRKIAKGLGVGNVDVKSFAEVKLELRTRAKANPGQFWMDANSRDIQFGGMVQDGIDKQIFKVIVSSGVKHWFINNREICAIAGGANEVKVLKDALLMEPDLIGELNELLNNKDRSKVLDSPALSQIFDGFKTPENVTSAEVSPNLHRSNLDVIRAQELKEKIKEWADAEAEAERTNIPLHPKRKEAIEKHRAQIDEYKLSEEYLSSKVPV